MELLEILSNLDSASSGNGISFYSTRCPRQAKLDKEFPRPSSFNAQVGTVFHKLMELYYGGKLGDVALPIDDMADFDKDPVAEACRLFAGYTQFFPADEWEVLHVEKQLPHPDDETMKRLVEEAVGVSPFTCRIDMVVRINDAQARAFTERRHLSIDPGLYIVDHKTADKKDNQAALKYEQSAQFVAYQLAWNAAYYPDEVKGVIVNNCIRHKKLIGESFRSFFVGTPSETKVAGLRKWLAYKAEFLKTDIAEWSACSDWGSCVHYMNGNCDRL